MSIKKRLSALLIAVVLISSRTILPVSAVSDDLMQEIIIINPVI